MAVFCQFDIWWKCIKDSVQKSYDNFVLRNKILFICMVDYEFVNYLCGADLEYGGQCLWGAGFLLRLDSVLF